jgi:hypothetical protein
MGMGLWAVLGLGGLCSHSCCFLLVDWAEKKLLLSEAKQRLRGWAGLRQRTRQAANPISSSRRADDGLGGIAEEGGEGTDESDGMGWEGRSRTANRGWDGQADKWKKALIN